MSINYSPTIVTDGIVGNWDPKVREYPPRGIATIWEDYAGSSAHYTILGDDGVILKDTSTSWVGYFPATITPLGGYTVTFDVVADAVSSIDINNDGASNNAFLASQLVLSSSVTHVTLKGTMTSTGVCKVYIRRVSGGNITVTNFRLFESGPWLYDDAGGSDGRGSGNNGLMHNGTCLAFDGTDDRIELDDLDSQFSDYFTLSVWLHPLDKNGQTWVFAGENGGGIGFYIRQSVDDLIFRHNGIGDGTTNVADFFSYNDQGAPVGTAWIHCVFNWDGVNTNVYRDGVRVGGEAATGTLAADAFNAPRIGDDTGAADREWYGEMADFRLYNVALSASQVTEIYNDSKVIIPSNASQANLIVWYPMTEGAGDLVYDGSGQGYTGTFSNAPTWTTAQTGPPQLIEGYNRPMLFNGSSDYVTGNDGGFPSGNSARTISAWINPSSVSVVNSTIFGYGTVASYQGWGFDLDSNQLNMQTYAQAASAKSTGLLVAKKWQHVAATYDGTTVTYYIDGVASGTATFSNTPNTTLNVYEIGRTVWASGRAYVGGIINEVVLYNSALSLAQVQALAATGPNITLYNDPMSANLTARYDTNGTLSFDTDHYEFISTGNRYFSINAAQAVAVVKGKKYTVSVDAKDGTASGIGFKLQYWDGVTQEFSSEFTTTSTFSKASFEFTTSATDADVSIGVDAVDDTSGNNVEFKNLVLVESGDPLPPDPMSLSNSSDVVAYWRNDDSTTWKNRVPGVVKNFTAVATDPINDANTIGDWTNNGTSLTSVTGGRTGFIDGAMRVAPRYRLLFDSPVNCTANSICGATGGKSYKVSAWYLAGSVSSAMLRVDDYGSGALTTAVAIGPFATNTTSWTNATDTFTADATGNVTIELHNRAVGTQFFDDVTLVESGPALDGTVNGSPDTLLFKQGYNGSGSTSTGRDNQGFPLLGKNNGAIGFNGISDYVAFTSRALAGEFTISMWINPHDATSVNLLGLSSSSANYLWINSNSEVDLKSSDIDIEFTDSNITAGVWQYICITRDGSDIPKFYRDSLLIQTLAADAGTFTFDQIGRYHDGSTGSAEDFFFNGQIANLQVYSRALSVAEITQNMNAQRSRFI